MGDGWYENREPLTFDVYQYSDLRVLIMLIIIYFFNKRVMIMITIFRNEKIDNQTINISG